MLRRDFISKIIEQFVNAISRMLKLDYRKENKKFLENFDESLHTYFKISSEDLDKLLEENEDRDVFLLDEKLRNQLLSLFIRAGLALLHSHEKSKAEKCLEIVKRIQKQHSTLYEFPSEESLRIEKEWNQLRNEIKQLSK